MALYYFDTRDNGDFVEDDGGVFYEYGVGKFRRGWRPYDRHAERSQQGFVRGVLLSGSVEVDRLAREMCQLAVGE